MTYNDARPWAKAIKTATTTRKMPPWFADPQAGHFLNDRSLKQNEIDLIARWADTGAAEGDGKDAPPPVQWPQGWHIQPDIIVEGPTTEVPAHAKNDVVEWMSVTVPTGFKEDTWITSVQIKPEHTAVAHHICMGFNAHTPNVEYFKAVWIDNRVEKMAAPFRIKDRRSVRQPRAGGRGAWRKIATCPATRWPTTARSTPPNW